MKIQEVAPPTKKHERMVKHIKKSYKKDGKLTDDEKSIAYATAWKNYNKEEVVLEKDLNPSIEISKIKLEKKKKEDAKKKKAKALAKGKQRATGVLKKYDTDGDGYVRTIDAGYEPEGEMIAEKDLNAAERRALPDKDFALPGKGKGPEGKQAGSYPIPDKTHARMALAMVAKHGTSEKKAKVRAAVEKKFPGIKISEADDKAYKHVVSMLQQKYGKDSVLTKDSPKPKPQPKRKPKPQKPLTPAQKAQLEVDVRYPPETPGTKRNYGD